MTDEDPRVASEFNLERLLVSANILLKLSWYLPRVAGMFALDKEMADARLVQVLDASAALQ